MTVVNTDYRAAVGANCAAVRLVELTRTSDPHHMNHLSKYLVEARIDDIHRDARRTRGGAATFGSHGRHQETLDAPITIRRATAKDAPALRHVASLDSAAVPAAPVLLAEAEGEVRAAMSLVSGAIVADPFYPTCLIVELLRAYAAHERDDRRPHLRRRLREALLGRARGGPLAVARAGVELRSPAAERSF
jgi:hypothetical protein